jgi:hypothetical protein
MIFDITAPDDGFRPITIVSVNEFKEKYKLNPIDTVLETYNTRGVFVYSDVVDLFSLPVKEIKEINLPFSDGILHVNSIFKNVTWILTLFRSNFRYVKMIDDVYASRGVFDVKITTPWGTINTFKSRIVNLTDNSGVIEFNNPNPTVHVEQKETITLLNNPNATQKLYGSSAIFAQDGLYPIIWGDKIDIKLNNSIFIVNPDKFEINYRFKLNVANEQVTAININNIESTFSPITLSKDCNLKVSNLSGTVKIEYKDINETTWTLIPGTVGTIYTTNNIDLEMNESFLSGWYYGSVIVSIYSSGDSSTIS